MPTRCSCMTDEILTALRDRGWRFYTFIGGGARFMFAWDSDFKRIDALLADLEECAWGASVTSTAR